MSFGRIMEIFSARSKDFSLFEIPKLNFIGQSPLPGNFIGDNTYFEVWIDTIFLQYRRKAWVNFIPFAVTNTKCLYGQSREEMPFVVGPKLLSKVEKIKETDQITYKHVRVAGPQPYLGDVVELFTGLWGVPTRNFAKELISFAETLNKAIQTPQLGACLVVAKPLIDGLESLLNINTIALKVGYLVGYGSPPQPPGPLGPNDFRPGHFAMVSAPNLNKSEFWIKEDRLFYGATQGSATPYVDADYMLFSIRCDTKREDITTFPFFKKYYLEAVQKVWKNKDAEADELLNSFLTELAGSPDFISGHRYALVTFYKANLEKEKAARDSRASGQGESEIRDTVKNLASDFVVQASKVASRSGLSKPNVNGITFAQSLFDKELDAILSAGQEGGLSHDKLAGRVVDYAPTLKKYHPEELAVALRKLRMVS